MTESTHIADPRPGRYVLAGWLAIASAVLIVPEMVIAVLLKYLAPGLEVALVPIHTLNAVVGIFILIMFRRLLNERFDFHNTDAVIMVLICINVASFIIGLFALSGEALGMVHAARSGVSAANLIIFILYGIVEIVFGVQLLKLQDDLFGLLKPYAYTKIISAALGVTVLLAPLGLLAALACLIMMGMIFLRASREADIL